MKIIDKNIYDSLRTWAEVDIDILKYNHSLMRKAVGEGTKIAAIIKADAYGHGSEMIARYLERDVDYFAVATADEAVELRNDGIRKPILVLSDTLVSDVPYLIRYDIDTTVSGIGTARQISSEAEKYGAAVNVHVALDTGMSRIGFNCTEHAERSKEEIKELFSLKGLRVTGIFSHYAAADASDLSYMDMQTEKYESMVSSLEKEGYMFPIKHICNSAAGAIAKDKFDMVREGVLLYGLLPSDEIDLSSYGKPVPAMSLKTHVSMVKTLPAGTSISYGCTYTTDKETVVATAQAGYADGVPRSISNKGEVLIHGKRAPIIGRVCMDQLMVDVTNIGDVRRGDTVTIYGHDNGSIISADEVASLAGTIGYEIICSLSRRVPKVYIKDGKPVEIVKYIHGIN